MYCLKCGQETENEQAFCLDCQKEMAKYPVDPNAVVHLPPRRKATQKKPVKRKPTADDQIRILKRRIRTLAGLLAAALLIAACLCVPIIRDLRKEKAQIGQNYSTLKPSAPPASTEPKLP